MKKFVITETRREIWKYYHKVEAATKLEAERMYLVGDENVEIDEDGEYIDTTASDVTEIGEA